MRRALLDNAANYDKVTPAFGAVRVVLGNGLLMSAGAFWKRQRRIAQPAFHGESVKRFGLILTRMAAETAAEWDEAARAGASVDACADMMRVTLRAVAETPYGDDLGDSVADPAAALASHGEQPAAAAGARRTRSGRQAADRHEAAPAGRGETGRPGPPRPPTRSPGCGCCSPRLSRSCLRRR